MEIASKTDFIFYFPSYLLLMGVFRRVPERQTIEAGTNKC